MTSKTGGKRISSAAFQPSSIEQDPYRGLSVDLEALIIADRGDPRAHVTTPQQPGSVVLVVEDFRSRDFLVGYDPTITPPNKYHGQVWEDTMRALALQKALKGPFFEKRLGSFQYLA